VTDENAIVIRRAGPGDAAAILPLMVEFNAHERIPWRPGPMGSSLGELLADPRLGCVLVAEHGAGRELAGYAIGAYGYDIEFAGRDAFVNELFVAPAFRSRGCGRLLLERLIQTLREVEVRAVHLMVRPENASARALYEALGFKVVPRLIMTQPL
jgi:ribosomal protein S18 acetylase RimI-like enzyme